MLTFHIVALSRIFFRSADVSAAMSYFGAMLNFGGQRAAPFDVIGLTVLALAIAAHFVARSRSDDLVSRFVRWPVVAQAMGLVVTTYFLLALSANHSAFAYFHF